MPIPIPRSLVDFILLGPADDRRQLAARSAAQE
jgi:hypothetical protein